jgi:hypothetical protein
MKEIPKASNRGANQYQAAKPTALSEKQKPKKKVIEELGFTPKQAERFVVYKCAVPDSNHSRKIKKKPSNTQSPDIIFVRCFKAKP